MGGDALGTHWGSHGVPFGAAFWGEIGQFWAKMGGICRVLGSMGVCGGVGSEMGSFGCVIVIALGVHWGPHRVPFGAAFWGEMGQFWATMGRICRVLGYDWYPWGCVGVHGGVWGGGL